MRTILLSAVEPSADQIGADLMAALERRMPGASFVGVGGTRMAARGLDPVFDPSALSVMGLADAARAVPSALSGARRLAALARDRDADAAVLIDGWGLSRLVATRLARTSPRTKRVKLAAPQVWASRPGRTAFVARRFDLTLTLLPFEAPLFEAAGARAAFVGNPNFQAAARAPRDGAAFRARHGLGTAPVLVVLPGSRAGEVARLMDVFVEAATAAASWVPGLRLVIPAAPAVETQVRQAAARWPSCPLVVPASERFDAFAAAAAALAASGTVTTELAICGVPMVVAYRVDPLTAAWVRRVAVTPYVTVLNVAAGEAVVPERLQEDCAAERLTEDVVRLLTDGGAREAQRSAFCRLVPTLLGPDDPAARAAEEIAALLGEGEDRVHLDAGP